MGYVLTRSPTPAESLRWTRKAYELNTFDLGMAASYGYALIFNADYGQGTPILQRAVTASSAHPTWWDYGLFLGHFMQDDAQSAANAVSALASSRRAHYLAARLIAYSQDYAAHSYYLQPFRDKVSVIYPPTEVPEPQPARVAELRARWQKDGGPVIGYAGRFVEEKRPDLLIRALEVINQTCPNARVVFAGEYDIRYEDTWERNQALIQRYGDQLIFLGQLTSMQAMANFFAACDVLAMPSDTECFALVQVESMLCGTPVVMTDTPGGRVPVTETGMGRIVPRGDAPARILRAGSRRCRATLLRTTVPSQSRKRPRAGS